MNDAPSAAPSSFARRVAIAIGITALALVLRVLLWHATELLLLATPLTAAALVLVRWLYLEDVLGDREASEPPG